MLRLNTRTFRLCILIFPLVFKVILFPEMGNRRGVRLSIFFSIPPHFGKNNMLAGKYRKEIFKCLSIQEAHLPHFRAEDALPACV